MSQSRFTHKAATYYLPSWQGGDVLRPLCHKRRWGYGSSTVTHQTKRITCPDCLTLMAGGELPVRVAPPPVRHAYVPVPPRPPKPRAVVPLVLVQPKRRVHATMPQIAETVALRCGLTVAALKERTLAPHISHPRQRAMWAMRRAGRTLHQVAAFFDCHHTTVLHAENRHHERRYGAQRLAA